VDSTPSISTPGVSALYEIGLNEHRRESEAKRGKNTSALTRYTLIELNVSNVEYVMCEMRSPKSGGTTD
jgi:hypothetical protein